MQLFDGAMGGPCFGDGSDSEARRTLCRSSLETDAYMRFQSQQSQATCIGQEDDSVAQTDALGPENIGYPTQYSAASTANASSNNDASSASQSLSFASNDLVRRYFAVLRKSCLTMLPAASYRRCRPCSAFLSNCNRFPLCSCSRIYICFRSCSCFHFRSCFQR